MKTTTIKEMKTSTRIFKSISPILIHTERGNFKEDIQGEVIKEDGDKIYLNYGFGYTCWISKKDFQARNIKKILISK